jgi:hypothetical protein
VQESAQESTDQGDSKPASDTGSPSINAKEWSDFAQIFA